VCWNAGVDLLIDDAAGVSAISWHFERDPIPYALETDWLAGAAGFEPVHQNQSR
jgi:hypothetical protein